MSIEHFQNLIIGSGEAGKILAWNLAKQGQKSVVVERSMIGDSPLLMRSTLVGTGSTPTISCPSLDRHPADTVPT